MNMEKETKLQGTGGKSYMKIKDGCATCVSVQGTHCLENKKY